MKDITSAFDIADILERVIPGLLLMAALHLLTVPDRGVDYYGADKVPLAVIALVLAYPVGVALNYIARIVPFAYRRSSIDLVQDTNLGHIRDAAQSFFGVPATNETWRLCYGIVAKYGYAVNMELFARLDIFCRSMMAGSLIILGDIIVAAVGRFSPLTLAMQGWSAVVAIITALIFLGGARSYSRAFTYSIYEGFYAWYRDTKIS